MFGEWLYAKHSIGYTNLTDYFILFDIYDIDKNEFLLRSIVEILLSKANIKQVPIIFKGITTLDNLKDLATLSISNYYNGIVEGVYVRYCDENKIISRGKIVRSDFISGNDHWTKHAITVNTLLYFFPCFFNQNNNVKTLKIKFTFLFILHFYK